MKRLEIDVHHVTRVEGHGNIKVSMADGEIEELALEIVESPRFFESMLVGRYVDEAPHITSRICGICAVGHTTAACRAAEKALGWDPPTEVSLLRRVLLDAEFIQSHILHLYFLVAPDLFGVDSVIPLAASHPEIVNRALRLKRLGNEACEVLVGRHVHPVAMAVGGFTRWPLPAELRQVREMLLEGRDDLEETVKLFEAVQLPVLNRPSEHLALRSDQGYALLEGRIQSTAGPSAREQDYLQLLREHTVGHSSARHVATDRGNFRVGALARYKINYDRMCPEATDVCGRLGLFPETENPFHNNLAQLAESVHCLEEAIELLEELLTVQNPPVYRALPRRAGRGAAAVEVPRGTLYHSYELDDHGWIAHADCIIPTGQNQASIEDDLRALVPEMVAKSKSEEEVRLGCEMLVRAYDPCISCAAHFLEVEFV